MPRHWPPNLGASRDIPSDALIHYSVDDMVQAGILDESPYKGGDNSHFPGVSSFTKGFNSVRNKNAKSKAGGQTTNDCMSLLPDGAHWTDNGVVESKQY